MDHLSCNTTFKLWSPIMLMLFTLKYGCHNKWSSRWPNTFTRKVWNIHSLILVFEIKINLFHVEKVKWYCYINELIMLGDLKLFVEIIYEVAFFWINRIWYSFENLTISVDKSWVKYNVFSFSRPITCYHDQFWFIVYFFLWISILICLYISSWNLLNSKM